jgi:hypothetical protein
MDAMVNKKRSKRLLVWGGLVIGLTVLVKQVVELTNSASLPLEDFVEYWAAARLNLTGGDPYNPEQLMQLFREVGWSRDELIMMYSPPWALTLLMPFGLPSYSVGWILWLGAQFSIVLFCADWIWRFYGGSSQHRWLAWVVGLTFAPTLFVLNLTQIGPIILLGIVGFLHFNARGIPWLAGAFAFLVAIKPQLLYLFWIAFLLWALDGRRWSVLLGSALMGLAMTAMAMVVNPPVVNQFFYAWFNHRPLVYQTPTLGAALRLLFGIERFWLQFVPPLLGVIWFLFYWRKHRRTWQWAEQMPLLLLVSLITTAYGWVFDQVVVLLAVVQVSVWLFHERRRLITGVTITIYLALNGLGLLARILAVTSEFWFVWMAPALLVIYLAVRGQIDWDASRPQLAYRRLVRDWQK